MTVKGILSARGFSGWRTFEKLLKFRKMIVKFLECRWPISQNMAHFSTCKNPQMSRNVNKNVFKMIEYCQYFGNFKSAYICLGCSRLFTSRKSLTGGKISN